MKLHDTTRQRKLKKEKQQPAWPFPPFPLPPYKEPKDFVPYPSDAEEAPL